MTDASEPTTVQQMLDAYDFFDQAIVEHGFTPYNRDYRLVAEIYGTSLTPGNTGSELHATYTFTFRGCVEANYRCNVIHGFSVNDIFIDYDRWIDGGEPDGFVWGVNFADAYPGLRYVDDSERATAWSERLGLSMHEVTIETNTYTLALVFHDITVDVTEPTLRRSFDDEVDLPDSGR
jgi:hypothetical protein